MDGDAQSTGPKKKADDSTADVVCEAAEWAFEVDWVFEMAVDGVAAVGRVVGSLGDALDGL